MSKSICTMRTDVRKNHNFLSEEWLQSGSVERITET